MQQLHIVNYQGTQIHSATRFLRASGSWVFFAAGVAADTEGRTCVGAARFVSADEDGYLPAISDVGAGITVTDVSDDGRTVLTRTAATSAVMSSGGKFTVNLPSAVMSSGGKFTVNLGDPDSARRGVQLGSGDTQINNF